MTTTIGVYDSGIGGLTTLSVLMRKFPQCEFCYYADNARMPFGTKSAEEVRRAVDTALAVMSRECTHVVLGCNTASVTANPVGTFKLRPRLEGLAPSSTLVLATPLTLAGLRAKEKGFLTADTGELAVLVEITAALKCKGRLKPDMSSLRRYLEEKLPRDGVENVILGCSHYVYLADQITALYPGVPVCDGNAALVREVADFMEKEEERPSAPHATAEADSRGAQSGVFTLAPARSEGTRLLGKFAPSGCCDDADTLSRIQSVKTFFTGEREDKKYRWLLLKLLEDYAARTVT